MVYLKATGMIHNTLFYYSRLNCLRGFDFKRGKVSRWSDSRTHCYFYNPLERKWLERAWFGKYGISWHIDKSIGALCFKLVLLNSEHTDQGNSWSAFPAHVVGELSCGSQPIAPTCVLCSWRFGQAVGWCMCATCFKLVASVRGGEREEEFLPCTVKIFPISFSAVFLNVRQKFIAGQPGARVTSIIQWNLYLADTVLSGQ